MGQMYENELSLLQEEQERKYTALNLKYVNLLTTYKDTQHKFTILEGLYEQAQEKRKEEAENRAESVQE